MTQVTMYDSTQPHLIPKDAQYIAVYGNGEYVADTRAVHEQFPGARILSIDVNGSAPKTCSVLDIERFDATPEQLPAWVTERLDGDPGWYCRPYVNASNWERARAAASELPAKLQAQIRWWVADWTNAAHIPAGAAACQWRSTNNFDISDCYLADFFGRP